jgi:hypothetical protein
MNTKAGKRTARFRMQTVENAGDNITLIFDDHNLSPLSFNAETGRSGAEKHTRSSRRSSTRKRRKVDVHHRVRGL